MKSIQKIHSEMSSNTIFKNLLKFILQIWFKQERNEWLIYMKDPEYAEKVGDSIPVLCIVNEYYQNDFVPHFVFKKMVDLEKSNFTQWYKEVNIFLEENFLKKEIMDQYWRVYKKEFPNRNCFDLDGYVITATETKITIGLHSIDNPE